MGYSRDSFYRYKSLVAEGGFEKLIDKPRRKPNIPNQVEAHIVKQVIAISLEFPAYGRDRIADQLLEKGLFLSPSTVRNIWHRQGMAKIQDRLVKLEEQSRVEGYVLTEEQKLVLESKREQKVAHGEIETAHPGYLGSQDTFYIGTLKGVGRVYQQTFVDTYSKVAICKIYTTKNSITAADLLNDKVLPFFEQNSVDVLRMLTDRGGEFCGLEDHAYELFLTVNAIEHSRTKAYHPQTNGICERFHRTILQEFYQVTFRKKIYHTIDELQSDLDDWLLHYNTKRNHQGKICCGRTPMETFIDGTQKWSENQKSLNLN
jgi:transposase InsO family protein